MRIWIELSNLPFSEGTDAQHEGDHLAKPLRDDVAMDALIRGVKLIDEVQNHRDANATSDQSDTTNEI